ncbi:ATP-binding protein [Kribbella sp. NPDC006257]|uniref:ATP-binding protein n=1 Tax=Kribbella sp. NPDC006257 TaxID=3156738 RepID=UPI0033B1D405
MTTSKEPIRQWSLDSQQTINWGCFEGYWRTTFAAAGGVTMFSGRTGSGKSTYLDANTVLMQPTKTRLNRASNAATTGHARNEAERNVVSYMRGMLDKSRDGADEVNKVLRAGTVWSAIAQTWRNADNAVLTAFVVYFARPDDQTTPSVKRFAHVDGEFDIRCLEQFTQGEHLARPMMPRAIKREYAGVTFEDNLPALHRVLWQRLGIGVNGDGGRAMELLHRVQSSDGIASVNELFTRLVLDKPSTFAKAADAVKHFAKLDEAHGKVELIEDQVRILGGIPDWWNTYRTSQDAGRFYASLAASTDPEALTPFWKWARSREYDLLAVREQKNSADRKDAQAAALLASKEVDKIERLLAANQAKRQANGGARIDRIDNEIRETSDAHQRADTNRAQIKDLCGSHFGVPATAKAYNRQVATSRLFETSYLERHATAEDAWKKAVGAKFPRLARKADLVNEQRYLTGRKDLVPEPLTKIRRRYSDLTGIPERELPFVAELIDMGPGWQGWRTAAELTLGGFAFQLLVPADRATRFRVLTDTERTGRRVTSLIVPL